MPDPSPSPALPRVRNLILAGLPAAELAALWPSLEHVDLAARRILHDVDVAIEHVYFPETGVMSVVAPMRNGRAVETATIGHEGMVGVAVFLGAHQMTAQAFCQVPGSAYRMRAEDFRKHVARGGELPRLLNRYTQALLMQIAQASACNRMHSIRHRCARWLLLTHDRMNADSFPLTQQFLSQMLGVQRTTVTEAARALEERGCISYRHGTITVRDRGRLEAEACECYAIIRAEFERLLQNQPVPSVLSGVRTNDGGDTALSDGTPAEDPNAMTD
jgi:CRP-like cAMP-binding protein